ncbi:MAG: PAS domain S-box protein, partial [Gemmatimonadota bacterium]|nr:PAS domain S-box protein [Gemmatimonadota bacterium]
MTPPREDAMQPLHVIIVEHDDADVELCLAALHREGFAVTPRIAGSRAEFEAALDAGPCDVVLADYSLPNWSGMGALEALRERRLDVPLILVTGTLGEERAVDCLKAGAADYVLKDRLGRLGTAVRHAVEARRELRERQDRLLQIADNIREVFFLVDAASDRIILANRAYETIWGRPLESLYARRRSFLDAVLDDDQPVILAHVERAMQGEEPPDAEYRIRRPDGEIRWIRTHSTPVRDPDGRVSRIIGVAQDITEQRAAQEALAESESRFRKLVEASFGGVSIVVDGVIRDASPGYAALIGRPLDELIGHPLLEFVAEESREDVRRRITERIEGPYEYVALRGDGRRILLEVTVRNHTIDGRPGRITALRDVTEKRLLEQQVRQSQKMEAVGRLAGGVAHDFNNLLTVITGHAELLLYEMDPGDQRHDDLLEVRRAADSAAALTRQLLAFSRQQVIEPRPVILEEAVNASARMLRRMIGEDITLSADLASPPSVVLIDPGQLDQILMNLAVNARDAMPGGGTLTIETDRAEFDAAYAESHWPAPPGRYAMLAITDTGIGMDEATRAHIFEPFFTTKQKGKGTGLGLATVYGIVKQHDGFIWVYSEPGRGTSFKIYLPLTADPAGSAPAPSADAPPSGHEVVLLCEDSAAVRATTQRMLERYGYTVLEAPDGPTALAIAARYHDPIDLLITDV